LTARYDERGNRIEQRYFGLDNQPIPATAGFYLWKASYDARNNIIEERCFAPDNQPMPSKAGYHLLKARYDARDNQIEWAYFDTEERPVIDRDSGVHRITKVYDELRRVVQEAYFGPDGKPTYLFTARYDEGGNRIEERYLDVDGSPLVSLIEVLEVFPDREAMRVGLQPGDFVWSYGDWVFRTGDEIPDFGKASEAFVAATRNPGTGLRRLVVIRGPSLMEFRVNPGRLGIGFGEFAMPDTRLRKVVSAGPVVLSEPTPVKAATQ
jgi:hypothetical protein